jgi:hypothetical protein
MDQFPPVRCLPPPDPLLPLHFPRAFRSFLFLLYLSFRVEEFIDLLFTLLVISTIRSRYSQLSLFFLPSVRYGNK